jgi:hypothetical protein
MIRRIQMSDQLDELVRQAKIVGFNKAVVAIAELAMIVSKKLEDAKIRKGTYGEIYKTAVMDTLANIKNALDNAERKL